MCRCLYCKLTYIPSLTSLGVELLDHIVVLCLAFEEPPYCFSWWVVYIPTKVWKGPFFYTFSPTFVLVCIFDDSHSNKSDVESKYGFDLHFPCGQVC
jgi:hypothetical protein